MIGLKALRDRWIQSVSTRQLKRAIARLPETPTAGEIIDFLFSDDAVPIQPWQWPEELGALARLVQARCPRTVLEIGTADGGTLLAHARLAAEDALIVSIDLPEGPFGGGYPRWRIPLYRSFTRPGQRLELLRADSHAPGTADRLEQILDGRRIDYAFVDGDHTYEGVREDFELCCRFAHDSTIIAFHDIVEHPAETGCEVHRFWREIRSTYTFEEFIRDPEQDCFGIGVIFIGGGNVPAEVLSQ